MDIDRRTMMSQLALLLGATSLPTLAGCKAALNGKGALDDVQMKLLTAIADTIIPATETPGAVVANVPQLISGLMRDWASAETRGELAGAIDAIGKLASKGNFADLTPAERLALLQTYDKAAVQPGPPPKKKLTGIAAMLAGPPLANPAYVRLKGLIINLYYNSEIAMTKEIVYEHVPGKFVPSQKITPGTRPFAGVGGLF
jgi:gluconate 2-dehydrogenase gamma chain